MSERPRYFLDACVFMYAVGRDHPYREPCLRVMRAVAEDELDAAADAEVVQEIAYRFHAIGHRADGVRLARAFLRNVPTILPVDRINMTRALELMESHPSLAPRDAIHVAVMQAAGMQHIITADRHFDRLPGVVRVGPAKVDW